MDPGIEKGRLSVWKADRGFGFIKPYEGGKDVFLHISALKGVTRPPQAGDIIIYKSATEPNGKVRATKAQIQGASSQPLTTKRSPSKHRPGHKATNTTRRQRPFSRSSRREIDKLVIALLCVGAVTSTAISAITGQFTSAPESPPSTATQPNCRIKGNISQSTGQRFYHVPGMRDYSITKISAANGERWFCSESEAIAAGWAKAPH